MATEVSVRNGSTGAIVFYSTYAAARSAASSGDTINIWANLDEQILLKNGVNVWIAPGRIVDMTSDMPTVIDNYGDYSDPVTCNIYGTGIIKNSYSSEGSTGNHYECIRIANSASKVSVQCDYIAGVGTVYNPMIDSNQGISVLLDSAQPFDLFCNKVINQNNSAIVFGSPTEDVPSNKINIQVQTIQTGLPEESASGRTALEIRGTGFINIGKIICTYKGACLIHRSGSIIANIKEITTNASDLPAVFIDGGDGSQNLTLYFNKIQNLNSTSGDAVKVTEGIANLIGRRIYSNKGLSLDLSSDIISAFVQCNEIISGTKGINIYNNSEAVTIDANFIEGSNGHYGVVFCDVHTKLILRNAKIKNTSTSSSSPYSICIYINASSYTQYITIENITVVTGNTSNGKTIFTTTGADVTFVKNTGVLFVNKNIQSDVNLQVGTAAKFKYIQSNDVT